MTHRLDSHRLAAKYDGLGFGWGSMISKASGGDQKQADAQQASLAAQSAMQEKLDRERDARSRAEASQARARMLIYGLVGVVAVGGLGLLAWKVAKR
jgi:hypothetical protein